MKLATLDDGTRDGQLALVSRDLKTAHLADAIAPTLQAALDDWGFIAPQLADLSVLLNSGRAQRSFDFDPARCMAPLPRACQWVVGSPYALEGELAQEPGLRQGASDAFLSASADIVLAHEEWGIDLGAGLAVITGDVPMGANPDQALMQIRLLTLVNDISLRNLMAPGLPFAASDLQAKPATAFAPLAVTPDELGEAWQDARLALPLRVSLNGKLLGQPNTGHELNFNFAQLITWLCRTRAARAGTIVGAAPVANPEAKKGDASIAARRARELADDGVASTPFMLFGDMLRIEMLDANGKSIFGAIEQTLKQAEAKVSSRARV